MKRGLFAGKRSAVSACVAGLLAMGAAASAGEVVSPAPGSPDSEGIIFDRQLVMTQLSRDSELLGKIVAGLEPAGKLPATTRSIAVGAKDALESFRMKVPGGGTKPEAWANYADFMQRMEAFARNAEAMAKVGETGNVIAVTGVLIDALPCKQCHDVYREPKRQ